MEAFILIGGRSSRMGRDKALVEIDGVSLAEKTLSTLRNAKLFSKITFVAAHKGQFAIPGNGSDTAWIFDIYPGRGPLSGIHAALAYAKSPWIFVTACDYPFATEELVRLLAGHISNDLGAIIPEQPDGRLQPLFAFYQVGTASETMDRLAVDHTAAPPMHSLVTQMNPRIVHPAEYSHLRNYERLFYNVNTPDDLVLHK